MSPGPFDAKQRTVAAIALAVLAVSFGAVPLIVRAGIPATHLVAMRVTLGALFLVAFTLVTGKFRVPSTERGRLLLLGVLLSAHWLTFFLAIQLTTVAVALALVYTGPIIAAALSGPLLGERNAGSAWLGLALAAGGMLVVVRPGSGATLDGVIVALVSAVLFAALFIVGKPLASSLGGLAVATWESVVAAIVLAPFTVQAVRESSEFWAEFLILGLVFTGIAGVIWWGSMRRLPVAVVSVIMYLEPASAVVWAAVFLGESPSPLTWLGVALVIAGGVLAGVGATQAVPVLADDRDPVV
ncbi:MAG: DMT family transporter [Acidimicrobiia bacterium]|nr:MAG: DMT family transporter [Acidimicrobiia bacterium]